MMADHLPPACIPRIISVPAITRGDLLLFYHISVSGRKVCEDCDEKKQNMDESKYYENGVEEKKMKVKKILERAVLNVEFVYTTWELLD